MDTQAANRASLPGTTRRAVPRSPSTLAQPGRTHDGAAVPAGDRSRGRFAFSLVELVLVVVIIGLISAIAIPRITRGTRSAQANAVTATVNSVRTAIDAYYADHDRYPGYNPASGLPDGAMFVAQLTRYTDAQGRQNAQPTSEYKFGPYLRVPFPKNPRNGLDTVHVKALPSAPDPAAGTAGWVAVLSHGYFGLAATDAELGELGAETPEAKAHLKAGPQ